MFVRLSYHDTSSPRTVVDKNAGAAFRAFTSGEASDTGKKNARDNRAAELAGETGGRFASMQPPGPRLATTGGKPSG